MKHKGKGLRKPKRRRRFKPSELLGFMGIGLFLAFVLYLAFAPQPNPIEHGVTSGGGAKAFKSESREAFLGKAAIIDQLGLRNPNQAFINEAELILGRAGLQVDVYPPEAVTVSLYKTISAKGYRLIVFRIHMGVNDEALDKPVGLSTTEPYIQFNHQVEQLGDWAASAEAYGTSEVLFAVSPKFIKEATVIDYPGTIIILSGCFGLYSEALPKAFLDRGASIILGWDGLVDVSYVDKATLSLLRALCLERLSVKNAVEEVMREIGPDPTHGSRLGYYPLATGDYKLTIVPYGLSRPPLRLKEGGELARIFYIIRLFDIMSNEPISINFYVMPSCPFAHGRAY
ncbi:MAG: hypothetical protein ACP5K1_03475 [Candidatus Bathyarchaeia archaeon]